MKTDKKLHTVLIVDDEPSMRLNLKELLGDEGYQIAEAPNGMKAVQAVEEKTPSIILMDIKMPGMDGLKALEKIKVISPKTPVIIFTAFGSNEKPIEAMKAGAFDYLEKPFEVEELLNVIERALGEWMNVSDDSAKSSTEQLAPMEEHIIGKSRKMKNLLKMIGKIAPKDTTVLLQGESGTGKEVIADAIHRHSNRTNGPFIKINCGALPESLLESELFGHEAGAFTGAVKQRRGRFELAHGGTIFLDEVDALTLPMQIKLLRVLQQFTFERVGGEKTIHTDARIIAATNKDLKQKIEEGSFRQDLFYRLNIIHLHLPPLRERTEDIEPLVSYFLKKYSPAKKLTLTDDAMKSLKTCMWHGNVRELENVIQRAAVLSRSKQIRRQDLKIPADSLKEHADSLRQKYLDGGSECVDFHSVIQTVEKELISHALERTGWNKTEAAKLLQINRRLLYSKMDQYKINK